MSEAEIVPPLSDDLYSSKDLGGWDGNTGLSAGVPSKFSKIPSAFIMILSCLGR